MSKLREKRRKSRVPVLSAAEAVQMIPSGAVVAFTGAGGGIVEPTELILALAERYRNTKAPQDLTLMAMTGLGDRGDRGLSPLAQEGLCRRAIIGHWGQSPRIAEMAERNEIEAVSYTHLGFLVAALKAEALVAEMAGEYLKVYAVFSPLVMCFFAVDNYLRICGRMRYSMWMNVGVSLANIGLDALFVAGFGWGIWSAALASCLCLAAGTGISFYPFLRKKLVLRFTRGSLRLRTVGNILANGSSEFFSNITSSAGMVLFNVVLMNLGGYLAVAAFSVVMYVDSIVKSLLFGMSDALQPAISYNYGAGEKKRVFALEIQMCIRDRDCNRHSCRLSRGFLEQKVSAGKTQENRTAL